MPSLDELAEQTGSQLSGVLQSAVETISSGQEINFTLYVKQVLPLDGFVYWVNASIVSPDELARLGLSDVPLNRPVKGSLHRQVVTEQNDTTSRDVNSIIFTPVEPADDFNVEDPNAIYLGEYDGTQFAFSRMESRYTQSGIFHYRGMAILPTMRSQIIDSPDDISDEQIISNSTPIWLALKQFATVYPSYLVPSNLKPPYIAADVRSTTPLQVAPLTYNGVRYQLAQDSVRVTLYGFSNQKALDFVDFVVESALAGDEFGVTNIPIISDAKSNQVEINALAKKKTVDFDVNYYQATTRDISRQLIKEVIFNYEVK
ncbi:hypothetical protein BL250_16620 [Erwinia sp. OLTSP20]|uniref:hypothetical protein n=1 Tax=unclassified Erwinia TaxID=2622719 RepID=UPI000C183022|nr:MULTISPECIES: hypothetical protein [unclassified Erwinia]PIJ48959.1 hypothetical protein BV501_14695 [Erwinia sp. OAMSP11]PIJ74613.1 hypothetical protein BK416_03900 [Erwinia sp. OLSSP12]PIJ79644.1 hypothetical protein BLD47_13320 [Erwinia sp. OLCASP19]PIJ80429.1 hypothetical protein BLD46_15165 [Erwinia sp. OLMTSP26]PIJ82544.1 hypothetical protein BLD49_15060 [Erwinia sp. OLMDSP33]